MTERAVARLDELARTDPAVAPLARLQAEALRAAAEPGWDAGVPTLDRQRAEDGVPLLHGRTVQAESAAVQRLLVRLAKLAARQRVEGSAALAAALEGRNLDLAQLLRTAIVQDTEGLAALVDGAGVDLGLLATLGQLAALPLLQACGRAAVPILDGVRWEAGYCPVCAAWPTLAELRGLERGRWLRCGRCGADWQFAHLQCPYCASVDHRKSGYLAAEGQGEARRATVCEECRGYLKAATTIRPIPPAEIVLMDAETLELDIAALEQEYGRPEAPGFPLDVTVELTRRHGSWKPWRR